MSLKLNVGVLAVAGAVVCPGGSHLANGQTMRFRPVAATGNVICLPGGGACGETEIILSDGGVTVTLFVEFGGWDWVRQGWLLGSLQCTLNADTLRGHAWGNPGTLEGFDLVPVGHPDMGFEGAFMALHVCTDDWNNVAMPDPVTRASYCGFYAPVPGACPQSHPFCVDRPDYVFFSLDNTRTVSTATANYSWATSSIDCAVDPDGGETMFYLGTLLLDVPAGARGTYNVRFVEDSNYTLWQLCTPGKVPGQILTPGQITIVTGATDCNENGIPDEDELESGDCNDNGIVDDCESDSDDDGTIDACDGCPDDPNKTEPGVCGCGIDAELDGDADGVRDCVDQCPGVDDAVFAPECVGAIPTVSTWGVVVLALLLLALAKISFRRRVRME